LWKTYPKPKHVDPLSLHLLVNEHQMKAAKAHTKGSICSFIQ